MPLFEFKLPDLGEGVAEGEVVAWHVASGDDVREDQEMVEVMTDKATVTIGAPYAGRIADICAAVGERVPVGSVLVVIDTGSASERQAQSEREAQSERPANDSAPPGSTREKPISVAASAVGDLRDSLPGTSFLKRSAQLTEPPKAAFFADKPLATPATRKLARDLGVDLRTVPPTGDNGRVTKDDVRGLGTSTLADDVDFGAGSARRVAEPGERAREERKPFVGLRRRIAERMQLSVQKAAHFTFVEEVDVDALKDIIESLRPVGEQRGVKLHYLPFIVRAVTLALKKHAILNSTLDERENELVYRNYYHIGIATATDQGLLVPVVRDADRKTPLELASEIQRLSEAARAGKLTSAELTGSTFTVTSLGKQGGLLATPVLNYPEVGILGVHSVKERPVVRNGRIVIGNVMLLSLSFDHRIIDGHIGAAFAYEVINYLENPALLLLP